MSNNTPIFESVSNISELASLLGSSKKQLNYLLYGLDSSQRYHTFRIKKRRGGFRQISAPREELKAVQRNLGDLIQKQVVHRNAAHGFIPERSIVTNATVHLRRKFIFNVDLKDFFLSVNFGRVRGVFRSSTFKCTDSIATVLAQICCNNNCLPQGAPTSPIISNLVCFKMDRELTELATKYNCIYTRYVDDITFSKRKDRFPKEIGYLDENDEYQPGIELLKTVKENGFSIHPEKVSLFQRHDRQVVTGLTVNEKVNVNREFIKEIRAMIHNWKTTNEASAEKRHHRLHYNRSVKLPPLRKIIEGKLNFLKMVRGTDDPIRRKLQQQLVEVWPEYCKVLEKENKELIMRDFFISHASTDKDEFVRPLVETLISQGISVWYDEYEMTIGSDIANKINEGLSNSRYGIVVLSPAFFSLKRTWPKREVGALTAQEDVAGESKILPILHNIEKSEVAKIDPILSRLLAWNSEEGPEGLAVKFKKFLNSQPFHN